MNHLSFGASFAVFRRLFLRYMCRFKGALVAFFLFAAGAVVLSVVGPRILGLATTRIFQNVMAMATGTGSGVEFSYIGQIALILLVLYVCSAFCQYMEGRLMTRITNRSTYFLRQEISRKINSLPLEKLREQNSSAVLSHVINDADMVAVFLNQVMSQLINTVLSLVGIAVIMLSMDWLLALIVILSLPVAMVASRLIHAAGQRRFADHQQELSDMTAFLGSAYLQNDLLRTRRDRQTALVRFDQLNKQLYDAAWRSQLISGILQPVVSTVSSFTYVAVCVVGGLATVRGALSIGDLQAFIQYVRSFTQPLSQTAAINASIQHTLAAVFRIFNFLDGDEQNIIYGRVSTDNIRGAVTFDNVQVHDEHGKAILDGLSFAVPAGSVVGIVGRHGSGKSAFLKALLGLLPFSGQIRIDETSLTDFSSEARVGLFTAAFQEAWLEDDTIENNIRYSRPEADENAVLAAAESAQAVPTIARHADGLDGLVGERHRNLSHGEAQLIALARTILAETVIAVLDDPLQSVDPLTKQEFFQSFASKQHKTVFIATGRQEDLALCDYILLLSGGRLAAYGTSDELKNQPLYRDFWGD